MFLLVNSPLIGREFFNHWFLKNPWVDKERAVDQVVMRGRWPVVEEGFKQQPRIEDAFDAG